MPGYSVTILGPTTSGKTTFLAALSVALTRRNEERRRTGGADEQWALFGVDDGSTTRLQELVRDLANRSFPEPTRGIDQVQWQLNGRGYNASRRWYGTKQVPAPVSVTLDLADPAGETGGDGVAYHSREALLDRLMRSQGIIFLFDPVAEFTRGGTFAYTYGLVVELAGLMHSSGQSSGGYLPHYVAVCASKFDEPRVFRSAEILDLVSYRPGEPGLPRVADKDGRDFIMALCDVFRTGTANLMMNAIEHHFRPDHIRYFVTSSIGLYVDPVSGNFDIQDFQNQFDCGIYTEAGQVRKTKSRIRGAVHPINVLEPLLWVIQVGVADQRRARIRARDILAMIVFGVAFLLAVVVLGIVLTGKY